MNPTGMTGIGVIISGNNASLRQALRESTADVRAFKDQTNAALSEAGSGADQMQSKVTRASKRAAQELGAAGTQSEAFGQKTRRGMREAADATAAFEQQSSQSLGTVGSLLTRYLGPAALGALAVQVGKVGIGFHDFMQKSELSFEVMLGSAGAAKEYLSDILEFAKQTPFSFPELTESAQKMIAFGVASEDVIDIMRTLGDATVGAGGGMAELQGLSTVIGQIAAKGRLQNEEILQLAERGLPALTVLANKADMTVAEYQKLVSTGAVSSEQAINDLISGLAEGTDGINGASAAYGGLMERLKESGGISATLDSTKSAFRNMSAELTETLVPAFVSLLSITQDVMGVVKAAATAFNELPAPVRNAALAFLATVAASRLLGTVWRTQLKPAGKALVSNIAEVYASQRRMMTGAMFNGRAVSDLNRFSRGAVSALAGVKTAAGGLMSALGGPWGIALGAGAIALTSFASSNAEAKARAEEFKATLDQQTGALTENSDAAIANALAQERQLSWTQQIFGDRSYSYADTADEIGLSMKVVTEAARGSAEALAIAEQALTDYYQNGGISEANNQRPHELLDYLREQVDVVAKGSAEIQKATEIQESLNTETEKTAKVYRVAALEIAAFTEEQQEAVTKAREAARSGFESVFSLAKMDLNVSTTEDLAKAQDSVADAASRVRDAEDKLDETRHKRKSTAGDIRQAEEAVTDARKAAADAANELADVESRRDPVKQYREQLEETLRAAQSFRDNLLKLGEQGLNGQSLQELIALGPEGAKDRIDAMLKDSSLIDLTNTTQINLDDVMGDVSIIGANAEAMVQRGKTSGEDFMLGYRIAQEEGAATSVRELADHLGESPDRIRQVATDLGLEFVTAFKDAAKVDLMDLIADPNYNPFAGVSGSASVRRGGGGGMADGGIYPGYTPGRDIGYIGISGGEAVMRPEWTRAMGPAYVHRMNALARAGGVSAIRNVMKGFQGGFANGGITGGYSPSPQVVTVPVTQTVGYPMNVDTVNLNTSSPEDFARQMRDRRRRAFTGGRP